MLPMRTDPDRSGPIRTHTDPYGPIRTHTDPYTSLKTIKIEIKREINHE